MSWLAWNMLRMSIFMTPVIVVLILLVPRLGRRNPPKIRCFIWLAATLRLLIPVHLSLGSILPRPNSAENMLDQIDQNAVLEALLGAQQTIAGGAGMEQADGTAVFGPGIFLLVWATGTVLFFCSSLVAHRITAKRLYRWGSPITDASTLRLFEVAKQRYCVTAPVGLFRSCQIKTPLLVGLLQPRIYLPNRMLTDCELANVLSHELCHYKRKDLWFKLAMLFAKSIHWFNPAVHMMLRYAEMDIEMACDSLVLGDMQTPERTAYGLTILSFVEQPSEHPPLLTTSFYGGKKQMKLRFAGIVEKSKKRPGMFLLAFCALLIVFCGAWTTTQASAESNIEVVEDDPVTKASVDLPHPRSTDLELAWPVPEHYTIQTAYGVTGDNFQSGIVISDDSIDGAPVIAAEGGTVALVSENYSGDGGYGAYVIIDHGNGVTTLYAHLSEIFNDEGDIVEKGQVIGKAGSSGYPNEPALQFELHEDGIAVDPAGFFSVSNTKG